MDIRTYYLTALQHEAYKHVNWVFHVFTKTEEEPEAWKDDPFPYRLVKTEQLAYYVNPLNTSELLPITGHTGMDALIHPNTPITLEPGEVPNLFTRIDTTCGNVFVNYVMLVYPFGKKVPFLTGRLKAGDFEKRILPLLESDPEEGSELDPTKIYASELYKFYDAAAHLLHFTQVAIPGDTEKSATTHPQMNELKKKLYEENKDRLHDPVVLAEVEAQLKELDKQWLEGDASLGLLINEGKDFDVVRRKLFYHMGYEGGFGGEEAPPIMNSLADGWDLSRFPDYNNASRAGTYGRGVQTALGGELVTWILRIAVNSKIVEEDCGSMLGDRVIITEDNYQSFAGYYYLNVKGVPTAFDKDNLRQYIGKRVIIRSPQFCKSEHSDYCSVCIGDDLSNHPDGISIAISNIGSRIMNMFMKAMHGKSLSTTTYDILKALN